jgi:predicted O-methyltransferase YrrM
MQHFYQTIHGWFGFNKLYSSMVAQFDNAKFVEVGSWKGRSASYMAVEIANSNKNIKFYCVDPWTGEAKIGSKSFECEEVASKTLYECFLKNIEPVKDYIIPLRMLSAAGSIQFEDNSLDFVFIDASHDYDSVKEDINLWS